jgi:hypothetical protein
VGRYALADACLRAALERPAGRDDPEVRRLLGYVRDGDVWATPFAASQRKAGKVRHEVYGWVPAGWVEHLERGELPGTRFRNGEPAEWLGEGQADALRASFDERPWKITTEHFEVRTNLPLREAIAFERELEGFHDVFFAVLADAIPRERLPLASRLGDPKLQPKAVARRSEVFCFANREEYVGYFSREFRRDEQRSLGYYMPPSEAKAYRVPPRSHFFHDPGQAIDTRSTLFHEASHQLLFEGAGTAAYARNRGDYWVWEGLGTYFETLGRDADGAWVLGEPRGARLARAPVQLLDRGERVPLEEFLAMGRSRFEQDATIARNYVQASALAFFLMHGDGGRYRDGFLDYVRAGYAGKLSAGRGLDWHLGVPLEELDGRFVSFLEGLRPGG